MSLSALLKCLLTLILAISVAVREDVLNGDRAGPHNGRLPEVLLVEFGEHSGALRPHEVRLLLDSLPEFLSVRVDRLAGACGHILRDLAPVLAVPVDSLDEALVFLLAPVALPLASSVPYLLLGLLHLL